MTTATTPSATLAKPAVASVHLVELADLGSQPAPSGASLLEDKYELLGGVKVKLTASLGQATLTVAELFALKDGSLVPLDKLVQEPLDITLDGRVIARGRLVAVGESFGISITHAPKGLTA
jgi:flagellar motor switch protein FliN/FliY